MTERITPDLKVGPPQTSVTPHTVITAADEGYYQTLCQFLLSA